MSARGLRVLVVGLAATHVAGLLGGHVLPWTGTLTMAAFLVYAWDCGPRIGLAALMGLALEIDLRTGGTGFPNAFGARPVLEGLLLVIALGDLLRTRRWAGVAAAAVVVLLAGPVLLAAARPEPTASLQAVASPQERDQLAARMRFLHPGEITAVAVAVEPAHATRPPSSPALICAIPAMLLFAALALVAGARPDEDGTLPA
ncbi:hypothetical protein Dvina_16455 [Dactylosporangium vinaceum]|uniref:Uncharacterized protein n=1 Tax=Dactylosporangium vinaceum TaxID=53362 RepID=A0ABV5M8U3_9ACTN|nr:hypothetical protein [Dactylosporangium vinaceum]UAB99515.1 hypothetical protein Dvina_16455 [Dactylosporangium vinaceum]